MSCLHDVCKMRSGGVAMCIVDPIRRVVLVGRERFGKYAGRFNICSGGVDDADGGCLVRTAMRELREELKLRFADEHAFLRMFSSTHTGRLRYLVLGSTPVFIGWVDASQISLDTIRSHMARDLASDTAAPCYKEMDDVRWAPLGGSDVPLSRLAVAVMRRVRLPNHTHRGETSRNEHRPPPARRRPPSNSAP
jgi:8-oxo-dGTP pyrophosphatase MutT (NUDIX family)